VTIVDDRRLLGVRHCLSELVVLRDNRHCKDGIAWILQGREYGYSGAHIDAIDGCGGS